MLPHLPPLLWCSSFVSFCLERPNPYCVVFHSVVHHLHSLVNLTHIHGQLAVFRHASLCFTSSTFGQRHTLTLATATADSAKAWSLDKKMGKCKDTRDTLPPTTANFALCSWNIRGETGLPSGKRSLYCVAAASSQTTSLSIARNPFPYLLLQPSSPYSLLINCVTTKVDAMLLLLPLPSKCSNVH